MEWVDLAHALAAMFLFILIAAVCVLVICFVLHSIPDEDHDSQLNRIVQLLGLGPNTD